MARSSGAGDAPRKRSAPSSRPRRSRTTGASSSTSSSELVEAGRVGRPHGMDGSFYVTRPDARMLPLGGTVTVAGAAVKIERRAGTEERPILRLEGHAGREAAESLRGQPLLGARAALPELEADEYWAHELEGCAVVDGDAPVGVVRALVPLPSCD